MAYNKNWQADAKKRRACIWRYPHKKIYATDFMSILNFGFSSQRRTDSVKTEGVEPLK